MGTSKITKAFYEFIDNYGNIVAGVILGTILALAGG
jgi:hypothetical protein